MTKKLKILITVASCAILLIAAIVAVAVNYHRIYVFAETRGWFRQSIGINGTDVVCTSYSFDEIAAHYKDNNKKTKAFLEAMAYQIAKEIASHYITLEGKIDAIILSGKIFSLNRFFKYLSKRIESLANIECYPNDYTFEAMIYNVLRVVNGEIVIKKYV